MKMIEVFKTDVHEAEMAEKLLTMLQLHFPESRINFDLEDCDKILRIAGGNFTAVKVAALVNAHGFECLMLE